ncbi:MAG TPA: DUF6494 family protein [Gemmatimonadales bacterium]|nr:DUF6494 family protein [Gemmatimonadales bacterium]
MNDELFNLELRKFLKRFGITAQREIERAVDAGVKHGVLKGTEVLPVRATLTIPGVLAEFQIDGEIALAETGTPGS